MAFGIGGNVGPYRIVEQLGRGGMATVYKAYHPALDRYVALKALHPAFTEEPGFLERFRREARIVAKLDHPNIVTIYDFAEHDGTPYLVMRYIAGETLEARLQHGPLKFPEILHILKAVGQALSYAHSKGVLHRDVKPSNIILTQSGEVYLTDFGLARMAEVGESTLSRDVMAGTPQYISPEQAKGLATLDARTDIYSLGIVLYELLVGQTPFIADTPYAVIHDHIFSPLPTPRSLKPDLPEALERVLLKALAKDPGDRYETADAFILAFEQAFTTITEQRLGETVITPQSTVISPLQGTNTSSQRTIKGKQRWWIWLAASAAIIVCALLGLLGLSALNEGHQADVPPSPENPQQLLQSARDACKERSFVEAVTLYQKATEEDPQLVEAYVECSKVLADMQEMDRAAAIIQEGLDANPDTLMLHERAAELAAQTGRWDVVLKEAAWLIERDPDVPLPHAYAALAIIAQDGTCEKRALRELNHALELDPDLAWAHYGLAVCHLEHEDLPAAREELDFILEIEDIPPQLRTQAEQMLIRLVPEKEEDIQQTFKNLIHLANQIPDEAPRRELKGLLGQAQTAWDSGDTEKAILTIRRTKLWVADRRDVLEEPLPVKLNTEIDHLLRLATQP